MPLPYYRTKSNDDGCPYTDNSATVNFAEVFCFWSCFLGYPVAVTEELDNSTTSEDERPCGWRIFSTCSIAFHLKAALYSSLCIFIGVILSCPPSMFYLGWWPEITGCPPPFKFFCTQWLEAVFLKHELPSPSLSPAYCCSWVRSMLLSWFQKTLPTSASLRVTPPSRCIWTASVLFSTFIFPEHTSCLRSYWEKWSCFVLSTRQLSRLSHPRLTALQWGLP